MERYELTKKTIFGNHLTALLMRHDQCFSSDLINKRKCSKPLE